MGLDELGGPSGGDLSINPPRELGIDVSVPLRSSLTSLDKPDPDMCDPSAAKFSNAANCKVLANRSQNKSVGFHRRRLLRALEALLPDPKPCAARWSAKSLKRVSISSSICSLRELTQGLRVTVPKSSPPIRNITMVDMSIAAEGVSTHVPSCGRGVEFDTVANSE